MRRIELQVKKKHDSWDLMVASKWRDVQARGRPEGSPQYLNGRNLDVYERFSDSVFIDGNVFLDTPAKLLSKAGDIYLELEGSSSDPKQRSLVSSKFLGRTKISRLGFEQPNGEPYRLGTDYFDKRRNSNNPTAGAFEHIPAGKMKLKIWPK